MERTEVSLKDRIAALMARRDELEAELRETERKAAEITTKISMALIDGADTKALSRARSDLNDQRDAIRSAIAMANTRITEMQKDELEAHRAEAEQEYRALAAQIRALIPKAAAELFAGSEAMDEIRKTYQRMMLIGQTYRHMEYPQSFLDQESFDDILAYRFLTGQQNLQGMRNRFSKRFPQMAARIQKA